MNGNNLSSLPQCSPEVSTFRIALIACYFGPLPNYMPLVFHSASFNPLIDWLIFTDQCVDYPLPRNVRLIRCTLEELACKIEKACGTEVKIPTVYDVARVRPALGLSFQEYLRGYQYWGHVDLDVIYGDLSKFLPVEILQSHRRIYCRGHLSIYHNDPETNSAFMRATPGAPDFKDVLANRIHCAFDEWAGVWKIFRYHEIPQYHSEVIADIHPPTEWRVGRFEATELPNHPHQFFYWYQGRVFQTYYHREGGLFDREVAYIHFQKRRFPTPTFQPSEVRGFSIGPDGFAPYDRANPTPGEMDRLNPDRPRPLVEVFARKFQKLKRKIGRIAKR